jgi:thiol:disulfide interchange protein
MVLLPALCCALPALIAAGVLGAVGGWLRNPWVIGAAAILVVGGLVRALLRRSG